MTTLDPGRFRHVRWLGGSACAGKTAVAGRLASRYGVRTLHCDELFERHAERADPERHAAFRRLMAVPAAELFARPVDRQVRELEAFYEDEMGMLVEDLLTEGPDAGGGEGLLLVEGAGLLPARVAPLLPHPDAAVWLLASGPFRRRHYRAREEEVRRHLSGSPDPEALFERWMARDDAWCDLLAGQAAELGLASIEVTGDLDLDALAERVAARLLAPGSEAGAG
ncbi:MAG TPA: hypothetical protein VF150_04275 [Thermoanaerobaculia bacterium]